MEKKLKMNQVALLVAAFVRLITATNDEERRDATKDIAWRSRDLAVIDVRTATSLAFIWIKREGINF